MYKRQVFEYAILIEGSNSTTNTSTRIKRLKESKQGRMADALALGGDEGRDTVSYTHLDVYKRQS